METVVNQPATIVERADRAHHLEQQVVAGCKAMRRAGLLMAAYLHQVNAEGLYRELGCDTFNEWLGSPEISLSRSHVYALTGAYQELVIERGIELERLDAIDITKLTEILPALRRGDVEVEQALSDAKTLSRSDLRESYKHESGELNAETARPICPACGQRTSAKKATA